MNKDEVLEKLKSVIYPGFEKSIVDFGFVKSVEIGDRIFVEVEIPSSKPEIANTLKNEISKVLGECEIVIKTPKILEERSNSRSGKNIAPQIKHFVMISSGKGGVGKSLVTSLLASSLQHKKFNTAILDADITGPSIPKMFGIHEHVLSDGHFIQPAKSKNGTKIISMNLCLPDEKDPVVWRGPVITEVIQQFWEEVEWSSTDFMFVDMPPGTGDVPLTVFQSLPVDGIVVVTSPQELVSMIVSKAVNMANMMNIPVLGLVENMSYFKCPDCGKEHAIFGESKVEALAKQYGIAHFARLPIDPVITTMVDAGEVESVSGEHIAPIVDVIQKEA